MDKGAWLGTRGGCGACPKGVDIAVGDFFWGAPATGTVTNNTIGADGVATAHFRDLGVGGGWRVSSDRVKLSELSFLPFF